MRNDWQEWTDGDIAELKRLLPTGKTYREIAAILTTRTGKRRTREAVASIVDRRNLLSLKDRQPSPPRKIKFTGYDEADIAAGAMIARRA